MRLLAHGSTLALKLSLAAGEGVPDPDPDGEPDSVGLAVPKPVALDVGDGLVA